MYLVTIVSILVITLAVYVLNRLTKLNICPICAGVSGTWLWMLVALFNFGKLMDPFIISILMGGSVVGIMYMIDNRIPEGRNKLVFKTLFFVIGFSAVYAVIYMYWKWFFVAALLGILTALYFLQKPKEHKDNNPRVAELEKKMENCCE